jgi:hypothetical protein
MASGADTRLRGSARGKTSCVGRELRGSFGSRRSLIVNRFPLDTLRAITTSPAARSRHPPQSAAREVLDTSVGRQRGCAPTPFYDIFHIQAIYSIGHID